MTRRAKIVCTMGPATSSEEGIAALLDAGMNVARMNFSHGDHADHQVIYDRLRTAAAASGKALAVLADLQGPKIRLGRFADGPHEWPTGDQVTITVDDVTGTRNRVSTTYQGLAHDARPGDRLLIDDGKVGLVVTRVDGNDVHCRVTEGGPVSNNKGISLPGMNVSVPALSEKDITDLKFALSLGVDVVALSFVRSPADITLVHEVMDEVGAPRVPVIAKIEKPEAVDNLEAIVLAFDGIMVARGDLGVELPLEQGPLVQKRAVQLCRENAKPVIVATQMLDSMIENSRPTRAEASDVANAVLDGTDAVMLSGETSVGKYPVLTVSTMAKIVATTEGGSIPVPRLQCCCAKNRMRRDLGRSTWQATGLPGFGCAAPRPGDLSMAASICAAGTLSNRCRSARRSKPTCFHDWPPSAGSPAWFAGDSSSISAFRTPMDQPSMRCLEDSCVPSSSSNTVFSRTQRVTPPRRTARHRSMMPLPRCGSRMISGTAWF